MSKESWRCPHCQQNATIDSDDDITKFDEHIKPAVKGTHYFTHTKAIICPNPKCKKLNLQFDVFESVEPFGPGEVSLIGNGIEVLDSRGHRVGRATTKRMKHWQLLPESKAKPYPDYILKAIIEDYQEACLIKNESPKASATLSRRCLQSMIRHRWKVKAKPNLKEEIDSIKDKVDDLVWKAIDSVRKIGNIGAHMEKDVNLIINIEPDEAGKLIGLIEFLIDKWYIQRHEDEERLKEINAISAKKDKQKNNASQT